MGLLVLAIADSAGIPIVGGVDALLITVSMHDPGQAYLSALCAVVGSVIGSCFLFGIARKGGEVFLAEHVSRGTGKRLHAWFQQYGLVTVFVPAVSFVPLPMKIPVFCSGALGVSWSSFLFVLLAARVIRYFGLAFLAQRYGDATIAFLKMHAVVVALIAVAMALTALIIIRLGRPKNSTVR